MSNSKIAKRKSNRKRKYYPRWMKSQFACSCGSNKFTIFREPVARKVHTRTAHRKRTIGICSRGHKLRIGF
jgi:hypothetical protein